MGGRCGSVVFFFSSRRRHTRWTGDWSSDVCSSDLAAGTCRTGFVIALITFFWKLQCGPAQALPGRRSFAGKIRRKPYARGHPEQGRSEERRVGKECRSRASPAPDKQMWTVAEMWVG